MYLEGDVDSRYGFPTKDEVAIATYPRDDAAARHRGNMEPDLKTAAVVAVGQEEFVFWEC